MAVDESNPKAQEERKLIAAYKRVAATPEGKVVFEDLFSRFLWQDTRPHVSAGNATGVVYVDAQRMLLRYIDRKVTLSEDELMSGFSLPTEIEQGDPLHAGQSHRQFSEGYL
jgi:hypothetical protein